MHQLHILRNVVLIAALLLVAASVQPVSAQDEAPSYDGAYFKRVNLVVSDLDRSLTIYRDILGFRVFAISDSSSDSYSYPVFQIPKKAQLRFATLSAGAEGASDEQVRTLAITEVKGIKLPKRKLPHMTASVIRVQDIAATFQELEKHKLWVTEPKTVEGTEFTFTERAFVDFDGHLIVLYEIK